MHEARINRVVDWAAAAFFIVAVAGLPAALISRAAGHAWPNALKIASLVILAFIALSVVLQLIARVPPVQRFLAREVDPNSKLMRLIVRLAAAQAGDPIAGSLARKHQRDVDASREKDTP